MKIEIGDNVTRILDNVFHASPMLVFGGALGLGLYAAYKANKRATERAESFAEWKAGRLSGMPEARELEKIDEISFKNNLLEPDDRASAAIILKNLLSAVFDASSQDQVESALAAYRRATRLFSSDDAEAMKARIGFEVTKAAAAARARERKEELDIEKKRIDAMKDASLERMKMAERAANAFGKALKPENP